MKRLITLFLSGLCALPALAENPAGNVTYVNRIQSVGNNTAVEWDTPLFFKNSGDITTTVGFLNLTIGTNTQAHSSRLDIITANSGSLDLSGISLTLPANVVVTGGSYADPAWITSLAASKVSLGNVSNTTFSSTFSIGNGSITIGNAGQISAITSPTNVVLTSRTINGHALTGNITLALSDVITLPADATKYLDGTGAFSTPSGGGGGALLAANNLSDLTSVSAAWDNLGLDTMAAQNAGTVNITGGNMSGVTIAGANMSGVTVTDGTIDGTSVGGTTPSGGNFTSVQANSGLGYFFSDGGAIDEGAGVFAFSFNTLNGGVIEFGNSSSLGSTSSGRIGVVAGEVFVLDSSGNLTQISPHAQDAPASLYEVGPGADELDMRRNIFLGTINWHATTRRKVLDALDYAGRLGTSEQSGAAWTEILARQTAGKTNCDVTESFADYQTRTGVNPWPGSTPAAQAAFAALSPSQRWNFIESAHVSVAQAAHDAWSAAKTAAAAAKPPRRFTAPEPALYAAKTAPTWCAP